MTGLNPVVRLPMRIKGIVPYSVGWTVSGAEDEYPVVSVRSGILVTNSYNLVLPREMCQSLAGCVVFSSSAEIRVSLCS